MTTTTTAEPTLIAPRRKRRRRRKRSQLISQRLVTEVNQRKRAFLREVSGMLTDAMGFEVRVSLVRPKLDLSPLQRQAQRMTKKQARRQMIDAAMAPSPKATPTKPTPTKRKRKAV